MTTPHLKSQKGIKCIDSPKGVDYNDPKLGTKNKKMKLVGKKKIDEFSTRHPPSKGPLRAWVEEVESASWETSHDIKQRYASASFLAQNTVIFNIGGNKFRLEVKVQYQASVVMVIDINTHAIYDKKNKKH
ncbi:type II toxin-antitoxin system HigB family toxin [Oceanicoccus sp. KOV_DT_Chl]|uniref:type II toxin-antitoxin system HigB family toxin n=1 Tax=Oceanicoccus sp. KOV_DT_Chl TaxID=1904639 RepID=UPI001F32A818|nr:type II toxin-antitoxin system HigB family toxin [Oceanicoccus sp. KOV_DT_Chl]